MNAARMRCRHAKLSEGGLLAGHLKPAEAAAVQDRADGALQVPRVGARKLDVAGDGQRTRRGGRRKAKDLDGGNVVRGPQITPHGLRKQQLKFRAELFKGLAVRAHQVAVEGLVQDKHRAPEHGR